MEPYCIFFWSHWISRGQGVHSRAEHDTDSSQHNAHLGCDGEEAGCHVCVWGLFTVRDGQCKYGTHGAALLWVRLMRADGRPLLGNTKSSDASIATLHCKVVRQTLTLESLFPHGLHPSTEKLLSILIKIIQD